MAVLPAQVVQRHVTGRLPREHAWGKRQVEGAEEHRQQFSRVRPKVASVDNYVRDATAFTQIHL